MLSWAARTVRVLLLVALSGCIAFFAFGFGSYPAAIRDEPVRLREREALSAGRSATAGVIASGRVAKAGCIVLLALAGCGASAPGPPAPPQDPRPTLTGAPVAEEAAPSKTTSPAALVEDVARRAAALSDAGDDEDRVDAIRVLELAGLADEAAERRRQLEERAVDDTELALLAELAGEEADAAEVERLAAKIHDMDGATPAKWFRTRAVLAIAFERCGKLDVADRELGPISDNGGTTAAAKLALVAADLGHLDHATKLAKAVLAERALEDFVRIQVAIARAQRKAGNAKGARRTLEAAEREAGRIVQKQGDRDVSHLARAGGFATIARAYGDIGDAAHALRLAKKAQALKRSKDGSDLCTLDWCDDLAEAFAAGGDRNTRDAMLERAAAWAALGEDDGRAALVLLRAGWPERARELAASPRNSILDGPGGLYSHHLGRAQVLMAVGDTVRAIDVARPIDDSHGRALFMLALSRHVAERKVQRTAAIDEALGKLGW